VGSVKTTHPHIEKREGYRGGRAIVRGTNFPVSSVVTYVLKHGMLPEELVRTFPHLSLAQVHDALSYYYDSPDEIDREITQNLGHDTLASELIAHASEEEALQLTYDPGSGRFQIRRLSPDDEGDASENPTG